MKTAINVSHYFQSIIGIRPWKARLGIGSFLTFEFGPRIREHGHEHGNWHFWIYQSNWVLFHDSRHLVDSDTDRHIISASIRRLQDVPLTDVDVDERDLKTTFLFDNFRLVVSPADYLNDPDNRDYYWLFFMPEDKVLTFGPGGIREIPGGDVAKIETKRMITRARAHVAAAQRARSAKQRSKRSKRGAEKRA